MYILHIVHQRNCLLYTSTVAHAYELLASEGYITSRMRSGYYVSYLEKDFFSAKEDSSIEILPEIQITNDKLFSSNVFAMAARLSLIHI